VIIQILITICRYNSLHATKPRLVTWEVFARNANEKKTAYGN